MTNSTVRYMLTPMVSLCCLFFSFNCFAADQTMSPLKDAKAKVKDVNIEKHTPGGTIYDILLEDPNYKTFASALKSSDLLTSLKGGSFTVLAPTNGAFERLPAGTWDELLRPENRDKLKAILSYHVIPGKLMTSDFKAGMIKTLNGKELTVIINKGVMINNAKVIKTDVIGTNGVIHEIDTVLIP